jgi:hypothetical protein
LNVTHDTGIAFDHFMDFGQCLVIVHSRVDADPVLTEVHAHHFVGVECLPDMGAAVPHPRNGQQFCAGFLADAVLLFQGGARLGQPVHQEVAFLEVRQQRLSQQRRGEGTDGRHRAKRRVAGRRTADDRAQDPVVSALEHPDQGRLLLLQRDFAHEDQREGRGHCQGHNH